jgi:predicted Zn-dependent peptidase
LISYEDTGMFGVYAGVEPSRAVEVTTLISRILKEMKNTAVPAGELRDAKEFTKGNMLLASESTDNQMVRLAQSEIHYQRYVPLEEVVDRIDAVTGEDIRSLATRLFQDDQMVLTVLGPLTEKAPFMDAFRLH